MAASLSTVGVVMNRVSMSTRADSPGSAPTFRSVNSPATWGFLSGGSVPEAPGMPTKSAPTRTGVGPDVQLAAGPGVDGGTRGHRGDGVAERDDDDVGVGANEQPVAARVDPGGRNGREHQAAGGRQGRHGLAGDRHVEGPWSARHQRGGDVADEPVGAEPCGQAMVAVVCLTGSNGTSAHSTIPAIPARTATRRAMRSAGTKLDGRRRGLAVDNPAPSARSDRRDHAQDGRSGPGLHQPLRVAVPSSSRAGWAFG